jgi:hypothetical protein
MSAADITPEQIISAIQFVPAERWGEVLHVIESLQVPASSNASAVLPVRNGTDLQNSDLNGIWGERSDLGEGQEFARELRRQAEQRDR